MKLLSFLCRFNFPFDVSLFNEKTILDNLIRAFHQSDIYDIGDVNNIVPAIKILLWFDASIIYYHSHGSVTYYFDINKICNEIDFSERMKCNYKQVRLILLSFYEGSSTFGILPKDILIYLLTILGLSMKYATYLIETTMNLRNNQIITQDNKRKKI